MELIYPTGLGRMRNFNVVTRIHEKSHKVIFLHRYSLKEWMICTFQILIS